MATDGLLLKAVFANPDDDLPRLVYADWLEENGQGERAEFIRIQCQSGYVPDWSDGQPRVPSGNGGFFVTREQHLHLGLIPGLRLVGWDKGYVCYSPESTWPAANRIDVLFRRGFIARVECQLADWHSRECERCRGAGGSCYACRNAERQFTSTGRAPGIGPQVVANHPIENVVFTDRTPYQNAARKFLWLKRAGISMRTDTAVLPDDVWALLKGYNEFEYRGIGVKWWETPSDAIAALSTAAIQWARSQIS